MTAGIIQAAALRPRDKRHARRDLVSRARVMLQLPGDAACLRHHAEHRRAQRRRARRYDGLPARAARPDRARRPRPQAHAGLPERDVAVSHVDRHRCVARAPRRARQSWSSTARAHSEVEHFGDRTTAPVRAETLWDRLHARGERAATICWPKTRGVAAIDDNIPEFYEQELFERYACAEALGGAGRQGPARSQVRTVERRARARPHAGLAHAGGRAPRARGAAAAPSAPALPDPRLLPARLWREQCGSALGARRDGRAPRPPARHAGASWDGSSPPS